MFQTDAGRTARIRPLNAAAWPLVIERQRLPRLGLSTLNSMAFGLAVYASPGSLPPHDARLASSCWSSSTGRGFHPQGPDERFQSCRLHLILLSQASWRNRCNLREFDWLRIARGDLDRRTLLADERTALTDLFWLGYSGRQVPEVCQTGARTGVAASCTVAATRARNSTAEIGDESVALSAAVPLSRVVALAGDFALSNG
mgnify:CR=1 FL=1